MMQEATQDGFDIRVHVKDPKTGKLVKEQHYRRTVHNHFAVYERGGKLFTEDGAETTREKILAQFPLFPMESLEAASDETATKKKAGAKALAS